MESLPEAALVLKDNLLAPPLRMALQFGGQPALPDDGDHSTKGGGCQKSPNPRVQLEVGLSCWSPLSARIWPKRKNATDSTDATDSISLADGEFELERPAPVHD